MTDPIGDRLHRLADEARPARIPPDLWRHGVRRARRRRSITAGVAAGLAVVLLSVVVALGGGAGTRQLQPIGPSSTIPSTVDNPLPFTRTVLEAPAGPAALLISGVGSLSGSDVFGYEGHSAVVNTVYRRLRTVGDVNAGEGLLLSPDGRFVAGDNQVEGADHWDNAPGTALVDLTSGTVRTIPGGSPVTWSPDGSHLLTTTPSPADVEAGWRLSLLDLATGSSTDLFSVGARPYDRPFAFSPDGTRLAAQAGTVVTLYDLATLDQTVIEVGPERLLAGVGAWRADGRIALWERSQLGGDDPYSLRLVLLDLASKAVEVTGHDPVTGLGAWLLGWRSDGTAVVETFHGTVIGPTTNPVDVARRAELLGLPSDGGRSVLVRLPTDVNRVEVARARLDAFGGPTPSRCGDWLRTHGLELVLVLLFGAGTVTLIGWYRRSLASRRGR
jgi:hypothetical protein